MPAGGMTADDERTAQLRQFAAGLAHLRDDAVDADIGAKVVAWNGDTDAMGVQSAGEVAEKRAVQRLPVTAMDEDDDRTIIPAGKEIDRVARAGAVANEPRSLPLTIRGRILGPARDQIGVFRNPRPVVVLDLIVRRAHACSARLCADFCAEPFVLASSRINSRTSFGVSSENRSDIQS